MDARGMKIAGLFRYPVKSMGGQSLMRAQVTPQGLAQDRRWMMVTPEGRFLTRRELPAMALVRAEPRGDGGVILHHDDAPSIAVDVPLGEERHVVKVWGDSVAATPASEAADEWLSARFGRPVQLVHMGEDAVRHVDPDFGHSTDSVSFADGFPLLVTTQESLDALNARLPAAIEMERFRPNLVLSGAPDAFVEDTWQVLRIGALTMRLVKPCVRCVITTQDPQTGQSQGREPLATLRAMGRIWHRQPIFGVDAIPDGPAEIAVGDDVAVVAEA